MKRAKFPDDKRLSGEFMAPLMAVYEARAAKGSASLRLAYSVYCGTDNCGLGRAADAPHVYVSYVDSRSLPLGWYLSDRSLQLATPAWDRLPDCTLRYAPGSPIDGDAAIKEEVACLFTRISSDINGR